MTAKITMRQAAKAVETLLAFYKEEDKQHVLSPFHSEMIRRLTPEVERLRKPGK